jgi:cell pole-organizing protein PopZ
MAEEKGQHEPSMEEILASIRRIIAADETGEGGEGGETAAPAAVAVAAAPGAAAEDDVLELTEVFEEEKPVAPPEEMPLAHDGTPLLKLEDEDPLPMEMPAPAAAHEEAETPDLRLVSAPSAAASVASLSQLLNRPRERNGELPLGNMGRTLEDMVRELLRPLLKDWLDQNLPPLVERLVHSEIERLVREAQGH